ncbi:agenet domain-containing protein / bromo-adjacent homology (BAH) domain-containing protein [Striga hermonthica]|uniref:Agenet domain-containing protein / bromo-adjacent homology (BAH) domain-containing protein n=1 Tax=Striga hermonthica TaxID=68872 RepID=A0A9N7MP26_STRHE|nr:agenet domain-containing protein / bromo-adjacent homology (BAH) domain-containing protein [Striga hermonthica]
MGAMENNNTSTVSYVDWEEVVVSSEKGRREVRYYLKRGGGGGGRDLVVVGKEKIARNMSYRYKIKNNKLLPSVLNRSPSLKLRSRREVMDWLNSIISGEHPNGSIRRCGGEIGSKLNDDVKVALMPKVGKHGTEFTWLGSSWICRKRRRHYESFCRNGAVISAQDFVYVLAEENKRLVAYLDDMYEDTRGNRMVVVRWFHRIDEVGFVLSPNDNDREIFFSLCLQDISIECIDGLATVLSPAHYDKCLDEAARMGLSPFVCYRQFDNEELKPFDVTRVKGYWKQELLRKMSLSDDVGFRPNKKVRWSKECDVQLKSPDNSETIGASLLVCGENSDSYKGDVKRPSVREGRVSLSEKSIAIPVQTSQFLTIGSQVEVLSQDSGIRGCWFRALIIKKHNDKVKVQYRDLKDAIDESKNLQEWMMGYRLAAPDALGIRLSGRTIVRPTSPYENAVCGAIVGSVVDAWWNDGWWEGIVVKQESEDRLHVYLPEEKQELQLALADLRPSKEWLDNSWHNIKERPELVSKLSFTSKTPDTAIHKSAASPDKIDVPAAIPKAPSTQYKIKLINRDEKKVTKERQPFRDLTKDELLARLRWKSSGKRRRSSRSPVHKSDSANDNCNHNNNAGFRTLEKLFVNSSTRLDSENCKYVTDSHFTSSVVSPLTNLVMSR